MTDEEKSKVDQEVMDIIGFHLKVLGLESTKENINLATQMFIEGVKYWQEKQNED